MADMYVFSTLTANQKYPIYSRIAGRDAGRIDSYVLIRGGANLPAKGTLVTPKGVMTRITGEEWERLQKSSGFQLHVENGFITVEDIGYEVNEVAENLEPKDASAPLIPEDFGSKAPEVATLKPVDAADTSRVLRTQRRSEEDPKPKDEDVKTEGPKPETESAETSKPKDTSPEKPKRKRRGSSA